MIAAAVPIGEGPEVIVVGRRDLPLPVVLRVRWLGMRVVLDDCRLPRPSGIAAIDALPCHAAEQCAWTNPKDTRELEQCVERRSQPWIDRIVRRRRAAQGAMP